MNHERSICFHRPVTPGDPLPQPPGETPPAQPEPPAPTPGPPPVTAAARRIAPGRGDIARYCDGAV